MTEIEIAWESYRDAVTALRQAYRESTLGGWWYPDAQRGLLQEVARAWVRIKTLQGV